MRVEFLSPHTDTHESTHAHYDRTSNNCHHTCGTRLSVHLCDYLLKYACAQWWNDVYQHFINKRNPSRIYVEGIFLSPHAHSNILSKKNVPRRVCTNRVTCSSKIGLCVCAFQRLVKTRTKDVFLQSCQRVWLSMYCQPSPAFER